MSHALGAAASLVVGIIAFALTALALAAWRRGGDRRLLFVGGAFGAFAIKGILQFVDWATDTIGHNTMEVLASGLDLVVVILLVAPLLSR